MDFGEPVAVRRTRFGCSEERLRNVKTSLLSNYPNASANRFVRGAHHRRCAREGLTGAYDALRDTPVARRLRRDSSKSVKKQELFYCDILRGAFISSLRPLATSGFAPSSSFLVPSVCFSNLTMPKDPDAYSHKPHF